MEVPKITVENNEVILQTIEVPIVVNEKEEIIVMKKLSAGQRKDLIKKSTKTSVVGNQMQSDIDALGIQIAILSNVIIEAPFPHTEKDLEKLPDNVIDYLYQVYSDMTDSSKKKD